MARISADQSREAVQKSEEELYGGAQRQSVIDRGMDSLERSREIEDEAITEINKLKGNYHLKMI